MVLAVFDKEVLKK